MTLPALCVSYDGDVAAAIFPLNVMAAPCLPCTVLVHTEMRRVGLGMTE